MTRVQRIANAAKCFWGWPLLHTRIMVYAYLIFSMRQIDLIRATNSDTMLHRTIVDGLMTGMLVVIGAYVSPKAFDFLISMRRGGANTSEGGQNAVSGNAPK